MKIVKKILLGILALIVLLLITAIFVKKEYAVEREIVINKPTIEVFNYLKLIKNQDNFSKWNRADPDMKRTFSGVDGEVGFSYVWESKNKNVGKGQQILFRIEDGKRIETKLIFKEPMEAQDNGYFVTELIDSNSTKVKWGFSGAFPYPFNLMRLTCNIDKLIGGDMQTGLDTLKYVLEKK